jgi:hypothetical protein
VKHASPIPIKILGEFLIKSPTKKAASKIKKTLNTNNKRLFLSVLVIVAPSFYSGLLQTITRLTSRSYFYERGLPVQTCTLESWCLGESVLFGWVGPVAKCTYKHGLFQPSHRLVMSRSLPLGRAASCVLYEASFRASTRREEVCPERVDVGRFGPITNEQALRTS